MPHSSFSRGYPPTIAIAIVVAALATLMPPGSSKADSGTPSFIIFSGGEEVEAPADFGVLGGEIRLTLTEDLTKVVRAELHEFEIFQPRIRGIGEIVSFTRADHSEYAAELNDRRFTFSVSLNIVGMVSSVIRLEGELSADGSQITGTASYKVDGNEWSTREFSAQRRESISPGSTGTIIHATTYTKYGSAGGLTLTIDRSGNVTSMSLKGVSFGECSYLNEPSHLAVLFDDPQQLHIGNSVILDGRPQRTVTVLGESEGSTASGFLVYNDKFGCEVTLNWTTGQVPPTATPSPTASPTVLPTSSREPTATNTPVLTGLPDTGTGGESKEILPARPILALATVAAAAFVVVAIRKRAMA